MLRGGPCRLFMSQRLLARIRGILDGGPKDVSSARTLSGGSHCTECEDVAERADFIFSSTRIHTNTLDRHEIDLYTIVNEPRGP